MIRLSYIFDALIYKYLQRKNRKSKKKFAGYLGHDDVSLFISIFGSYESEILSVLRSKINKKLKNTVFLDVGAHIGNYSILLEPYFKKVVSFEPNPDTFQVLNFNCSKYRKIKCYQLALSNKKGWSTFEKIELNVGKSHLNIQPTEKTSSSSVKVECDTLDNLFPDLGQIGLIKIDVEGHEKSVLDGARVFLETNKPMILMELLSEQISNKQNECINLLIDVGYTEFFAIHPQSAITRFLKTYTVTRPMGHFSHFIEILVWGKQKGKPVEIDVRRLDSKGYQAVLCLH